MITIIVLLILAGVSISLVMGDSGVFTQAKNASVKTTEADIEEALSRAVASAQGEYTTSSEFNSGRQTFYEWLESNRNKLVEDGYIIDFNGKEKTDKKNNTKYIKGTIQKVGKSNELSFKVSSGEGRLNINVDIEKGPQEGIPASQLNPKADYGKYINYPIDTDGDGNDNNNWRIFYKDDEHIFIKAADYLTEQKCSELKTATEKAGMEQYNTSNYAYEYRWVNASDAVYHCNDGRSNDDGSDDIYNVEKKQCSFPETFMLNRDPYNKDDTINNHYFCSSHVGGKDGDGTGGNVNSRCASALQCTGNWDSFLDGEYGEYAIGGPTLEMWVASWNQMHGDEKKLYVDGGNNSSSVTGYKIGEVKNGSKNGSSTTISLSSCSGYNDTLYFPHQAGNNNLDDDEALEECYGYWLASPSVYGSDYLMLVNFGGYVGRYSYGDKSYGVRPVVSLKSNVKIEWVKEDDANIDNAYYKIVEDF